MPNRLVTVATFAVAADAQIARQRLEAEGIPVVLRNEGDAHALGGLAGVLLQVPEEMSRAASELLRPEGSEAGHERTPKRPASALEQNEAELERCLICQSSLVEVREPAPPLRLLRAVFLQIVPLPPGWLESRRRVCGVCKHEWKAE
jgi:hypothetical protein